jgi:hypothetical protein
MKRQFSFPGVVFALLVGLAGCSPYIPSTPEAGSALLKVECRDVPMIRQMVLDILRSGRGKDISVRTDGSCLEITAAFIPADTPAGRLAQLVQDLEDLNGVLHTEVVENPHPIRQTF